GAAPQVMEQLCDRLVVERPELRLVLAQHGYLTDEEWPQLEANLSELNPDLVLVALGVPRQELWVERLKASQTGVWMGVGGSFDVWAGLKERAPKWTSRFQLEWLYRLLQEPSRWRRYLALPKFVWAVLLSESQRKPAKQKQATGRTTE
ncbi:WecB/TagA/CpsF family glycosyltransferase, partial [bacterium]|nr:WecB/TagA/CpsF family glycosyltransferase [bacterium]